MWYCLGEIVRYYKRLWGEEGVPIPLRNHLKRIEKLSGVSCPTIWSRAYYSTLIQSYEPCLNKSASFPRESPTLHLSFFPFHRPALPPTLSAYAVSRRSTCRMQPIQFEVASESGSSSPRYIKDLRGSWSNSPPFDCLKWSARTSKPGWRLKGRRDWLKTRRLDASIGDNLGTLIDELKEKRTRMGRTLRLSVTVLLQAVLRREEN